MQRKICPICDHVMKFSHYCHFCKRWVSNPNIINATYYLNERHPAHETDCEYHAPFFRTDTYVRDSSKSVPKRQTRLERDAGRLKERLERNEGKTRTQQNHQKNSQKNRQKNPVAAVIGIFVMIFFLMTFLGSLLPLLFFIF